MRERRRCRTIRHFWKSSVNGRASGGRLSGRGAISRQAGTRSAFALVTTRGVSATGFSRRGLSPGPRRGSPTLTFLVGKSMLTFPPGKRGTMENSMTPDEAHAALRTIDRERSRVIEQISLPTWYLSGLAIGWVILGVIADIGPNWLTTASTG